MTERAMADIDKVLVANRGEIARRIFASCRRLGLKTVAVYSEADALLAHVTEADEAFAIGGSRAQDSYLRVDRLLDVAAASESHGGRDVRTVEHGLERGDGVSR